MLAEGMAESQAAVELIQEALLDAIRSDASAESEIGFNPQVGFPMQQSSSMSNINGVTSQRYDLIMPMQGKDGVLWQAQVSATISDKEVTLERVVLQSQTGRSLSLRAGKYGKYLADTSRNGISILDVALMGLSASSGVIFSLRCFRRTTMFSGKLPLLSV
eukprot:gnl/TRDRNA2_/TRDRNA2_199108_c0_seq1.p1 gnl/TRDRNA2_/TRDRNA2_199108_c0~~gnl/TRDRNA2_/TRDRNA2_199108_c0_seq1.p1  ORF type:complete len:175 (-),score=32.24 gnl/TRDRNA2_/TRDRNA2_199108_c0_seq1:38-520(-)